MVEVTPRVLRRLRQACENATEVDSVAFFYVRILMLMVVGLRNSYGAKRAFKNAPIRFAVTLL
ncbi:hypothetical protein PQQ86_18395 [Paraburkholderia sediminicola]|uniref:hypothetical protein n=1 Tax=Paraburkholderia sediminicola TaxID=458836 RepID=UPI0038BA3835